MWRQILRVDVLITHGPPLGRFDVSNDHRLRCCDLLQEVQNRIRPRLHIFGHVHESYGTSYDGTTLYVNAANMNSKMNPHNPCIVIDVPHDKTKNAVVVKEKCLLSADEVIS
mmetsp:Transcript_53252/g.53677  ORF Transcript_53252/g.53677 Transcript_53252/m.53677 type:complete len:112 (-) Transcript_53252:185-520(-)